MWLDGYRASGLVQALRGERAARRLRGAATSGQRDRDTTAERIMTERVQRDETLDFSMIPVGFRIYRIEFCYGRVVVILTRNRDGMFRRSSGHHRSMRAAFEAVCAAVAVR